MIDIVVGLGSLHQGQSGLILLVRGHGIVVGRQLVGYFEQIRNRVRLGFVLLEHREQVLLAEVTGMINNDILNDLNALGMCGVNQFLVGGACGLVSRIDFGKINRVIAVIIIPAGILHDRCNPDGAEAERFDVVKLLDQALEISSPSWIGIRVAGLGIVPGMGIVAGIAVIET